MKKSLKAIANKKENADVSHANSAQQDIAPDAMQLPAGISELISMYSGKSEAELMQELLQVTSKQKADGTYDEGALQMATQTLAPMLTEEQRRKLNQITSRL